MPFVATWMELDIVRLSDVSQTEKEKFHMTSLVCEIEEEIMQMYLLTKQKETHKLRELTYVCWVVGVQRRKGSEGVWDGHVNTAIFKMDNQQRLTV